jgi:hypothetical protein
MFQVVDDCSEAAHAQRRVSSEYLRPFFGGIDFEQYRLDNRDKSGQRKESVQKAHDGQITNWWYVFRAYIAIRITTGNSTLNLMM